VLGLLTSRRGSRAAIKDAKPLLVQAQLLAARLGVDRPGTLAMSSSCVPMMAGSPGAGGVLWAARRQEMSEWAGALAARSVTVESNVPEPRRMDNVPDDPSADVAASRRDTMWVTTTASRQSSPRTSNASLWSE
jgi:hypothetical protein